MVTRRKENLELQKHTLNLFAGDFDRLSILYGSLGASKVIRLLVHKHIKKIEENASRRAPLRGLPIPDDLE